MYGHGEQGCPTSTGWSDAPDGIWEAGITAGPVGYANLDDPCSEAMVYVRFDAEVVR